ncbi:MAG: hypothetical protein N4A59_11575 [Marinifilum sp.]|jgi:hypothetical protein|nr:hypothetical protein [Marinifilum sp.]
MKKIAKITLILFTMSLSLVSCNKDDDNPIPKQLASIKYSPDKMDAKVKTTFSSKEATLNPKDVSVTFKINKITKDKKSFTNPKDGGLSIDSKGKISAKKDHKLAAGVYVIEVTATNKKDSKNIKKASFTLTVK